MRIPFRPAVAVIGIAVALAATQIPASANPARPSGSDKHGYTFAVIGDIPYGDAQIAAFPKLIAQINADPAVEWVDHLGDIKNGSSVCSDEYFRMIKADFDQFRDPLVYTVGDNEWTDCHRPNNGGYDPLERLTTIRELFFAQPGRTLGQHPARVISQANQGIPEDVRWERADVAFSAVHIVGSNNSLAPWTGHTTATPEQTVEVLARTAAVIRQIQDTFADARRHHDRAVVLFTQADMFDPSVPNPSFDDYYAFQPIVAAIARESAAYQRPVYLFNGDSHVYNSDKPLAPGSSWLSFYGLDQPAPKLTRITVDGSTSVSDYLRVSVTGHSDQPLSWTRVPFTS